METTQLPIDLLRWGFALAPIVVLLVLLVVLRWTAQQAAMVAMFTAAAIGFFVYRSSLETLAVAGAKGVWDAVFILAVIWPASQDSALDHRRHYPDRCGNRADGRPEWIVNGGTECLCYSGTVLRI